MTPSGLRLIPIAVGTFLWLPALVNSSAHAQQPTPGTVIRRPLEPGASPQSHTFHLESGQFLRLQVDVAGPEIELAWREPAAAADLEIPGSPFGDYGRFEFAALATNSGDYQLILKLAEPKQGASAYEIRILDSRTAATEADHAYLAAQRAFHEGEALRASSPPTAASRAAALQKYAAAIRYFEKAGYQLPAGIAIFVSGATQARSSNFVQALSSLQQALQIFRSTGYRYAQGVTLNFIGGMYDVLGDPQKALEAFTPALEIFRGFYDTREQGRILNNIGKLEAVRANFQGALDYYRQAYALVGPDADPGLQAALLHNMAVIYETLGDFPQAISLFDQALPLRRKKGDQRGEADTLTSLGFTYYRAEQNEAALRNYDQSLAIRLQLGDKRGESLTRSYMSVAFARLGRFAESHENHLKAVEYAAAVKDRRFESQAWLRGARSYDAEGDAALSAEAAARALEGFRALDDRAGQANALHQLARSENSRNHLDKARQYIEEAVRLVESNRSGSASQQLRASYFATNQDLYTLYVDVLMRLGDKAGALHVSERSRSRSLLEMLAESGAGIREGVDASLLERERSLLGRLNARANRNPTPAVQEEIRGLERELLEVDAAIRRGSPRYAALTRPNPLTAAQIQDLLDPGSLLLEYSLGETRSYLWVTGNKSLDAFELPDGELINQQVARVCDLIVRRADSELSAALQGLRRMILPAGAQLGSKRLVIVADGALQRLPFSALLLDTNETVMLPSASTLHVLRSELSERRRAPPRMLAVFADPVFEAAGASRSAADTRILEHLANDASASAPGNVTLRIPPLPFTRQEADEILKAAPATTSGANKNLRALGYQANREAATSADLSQYRYLHFATHGYLDAERPGFSALVLSMVDEKGQPRDGFLRVNDIYNLKLAADLVVLSACQTGLGKEIRGEGLMGLTRAFMYAGAPRVVVSLWNVNDRATATLMAGMYRRMLREGKHPATALREAQLEMRKDKRWQSPYYWAAFAQHGEWK